MVHTAPLLIVRVASLPFDALFRITHRAGANAAATLLDIETCRAYDAEAISAELYEAAGANASPELSGARGAVLAIRRAVHQGRDPDANVLERASPLLSPDLLERIQRHQRHGQIVAKFRFYPHFYGESECRERAELAELVADPLVALGLRLASRSLLARASELTHAAPWGQRERHTASKVLAYLGRFATKTSPNGVFCATALGALHDGGPSVRGTPGVGRLDFALHVGEARKVTAVLGASPEAEAAVVPRANPTLRLDEGQWRLWQPATPRRADDEEVLLTVRDHPVLRMYVEAANGRDRVDTVTGAVSARAGQETTAFYRKLVERGVLIGEIEIPWSERRPLRALASRCPDAPWSRELEAIEAEVDRLSGMPAAEIPARIDAVVARLAALPRVRPLVEDDAVRCDAAADIAVRLPRALLVELERLLPWYARFYGAVYPEAVTRETFAARFLKRYPPDTPVPVLDFYHGLFEPVAAPALAAFTSAASGTSSPARQAAGRAFERARDFFAARARQAEARRADEVALTDADWAAITGDAPQPRFSCAVLFQVAAASLEKIESADARVCLNAIFPGAGLSVARLAHLHRTWGGDGGPIPAILREGWARRARPDAAFAEVTYMHGGRTANAGLRPPLFPLEIELPGERVSDGRDAVPLADLTATWDSAAGRFRIRSISRGIEILPVISSGIDPEGFISFLTMAGAQDLQPLGLLPGFDVPEVRRWPRFRYRNVVLFRGRWVFPAEAMPAGRTAEEYFLETQRWRWSERLPGHVFVHTDATPKPFYANLDSPAFVDLLRRSLAKGTSRVHVTEMLPGPGQMWLRGPDGVHASELLAHMDNLDGPWEEAR